MATVIEETLTRLETRLSELRPAVEEAARIEAALSALRGSRKRPADPITTLDMLKPVEDETPDHPSAPAPDDAAADGSL